MSVTRHARKLSPRRAGRRLRRYNRLVNRPLSVVVAAVLAGASCSSGGGGSGLTPAAKAKWNDYCAFRASCAATPCQPLACVEAYAESGPLIEFVDCQTAKACGANDDDCTAMAGTSDAERDAFVPRCEAMINANRDVPTCYIEPVLCTIVAYPLIRKEIMRAVDACLPIADCTERMNCVETAVQPLGCA